MRHPGRACSNLPSGQKPLGVGPTEVGENASLPPHHLTGLGLPYILRHAGGQAQPTSRFCNLGLYGPSLATNE